MPFVHKDTKTTGHRFVFHNTATTISYPGNGQGGRIGAGITLATWTELTLNLESTGSFTNYTVKAGDQIEITGGTGATTGFYGVASRTDANNIVLASSIGAAADGETDIAATFLDASEVRGAVGTLITGCYVAGSSVGTEGMRIVITDEDGNETTPLAFVMGRSGNAAQQAALPPGGVQIDEGFGVRTHEANAQVIVTYQEITEP